MASPGLTTPESELLRFFGGMTQGSGPDNLISHLSYPEEVDSIEALSRYGLIEIVSRKKLTGTTSFFLHFTPRGWQR